MIRHSLKAALIVAMASGAGVAHAGDAVTPLLSQPALSLQSIAAPPAGGVHVTLPLSYARTQAISVPGVAQTSVDHSFAPGGLVGSAGFLCGLDPGFNDKAATGYDPQGRFLGAKLSFAFK